MKIFAIVVSMLSLAFMTCQADCPEELQEARLQSASPIVVVLFDGLGTNELGSKLLQKDFGEVIERRCSREHITFVNFHYGKSGARKALSCLQSFKSAFGKSVSFHTIGHSFGAGKGVMNLLEISKGVLQFQNAITFDPRGYSYRYKNPGKSVVEKFINIYQTIPLAGRPVANANFELNAGASGHMSLPKKTGELALAQVVGRLTCAKN